MVTIKKIYTWEKRQWKKPQTRLAAGISIGLLIGIGIENIGLGIAIGTAIGAAGYTQCKMKYRHTDSSNDTNAPTS